MTWLKGFSLQHRGDQKLVAEAAAFIALCAGAVYFKANFDEFRNGLFLWLATVLGVNVAQTKIGAGAPPEQKP